jgi:hypothetical protein
LQRRVSRTDLDFEQALKAEGTVILREGVDVNTLGQDLSPPPLSKSYSSSYSPVPSPVGPRARMNHRATTPMRVGQPGTPVIVPPTPTPVSATAGPSSSITPAFASSSSPSTPQNQHDTFYDPAEDTERLTNRRSIYRSPGTSSSPDLTTLLRKAKEKGGVIGAQQYKNLKDRERKKDEPPPPLPSYDPPSSAGSSNITGRQRSSTSVNPGHPISNSPSLKEGKNREDWMPTSPRSKEVGTLKVGVPVP